MSTDEEVRLLWGALAAITGSAPLPSLMARDQRLIRWPMEGPQEPRGDAVRQTEPTAAEINPVIILRIKWALPPGILGPPGGIP